MKSPRCARRLRRDPHQPRIALLVAERRTNISGGRHIALAAKRGRGAVLRQQERGDVEIRGLAEMESIPRGVGEAFSLTRDLLGRLLRKAAQFGAGARERAHGPIARGKQISLSPQLIAVSLLVEIGGRLVVAGQRFVGGLWDALL